MIFATDEFEAWARFEDVLVAYRSGDKSSYFNGIRAVYAAYQSRIDSGKGRPAFVNWPLIMSPIEIDVWEMLNSVGAKMYPQYPVAGFFLDFASPHAKVGIECDGKMWHQDRERDARRDSILREAGWSIWRFSGTEIRRAYHANDYDEDGPTQTEMLNEVMAWLSHETGRKHA